MHALIGDLLDHATSDARALDPTRLDVAAMVAEVAAARHAEGAVSCGPIPAVAADPVLLRQVVDNLLENVVRHTAPEVRVRVSATADGGAVRLRVEDGGEGVPADSLPHIFEKFYRVPARRETGRQGTGLGLAVVKGMAEAMGGSVDASRSELGGLAVDVTLPVAVEPPPDDEGLV